MAGSRAKNVLLLIADDWSPIAGCYGSAVIKTPHVDALAEEGVRFTHAFCTTPSCAASRASILTGHYSHTHGQYGHTHGYHNFHTLEHIPTIPAVLRRHGYVCGVVGKQHVKPQSSYPWDFERPGNRNVKEIAEHIEAFLKDVEDRPFYLHVGFADPHRDFGNARSYPGVTETRYDPENVPVPAYLPDHASVRKELAEYYQAISRLDLGIGMAVRALEGAGRRDDTLILCMSDHGMPFPGAKASSFDAGHHCPLIVVDPSLEQRGTTNDALVNWCNIAPTIYDWCGVEPPQGLPERSLLPILGDPHPEGWDETYYSHTFHEVTNYYPYRVLRRRRFKYVRNLFPELTVPLPTDLWASDTWQTVLRENLEYLGVRPTKQFLHRDAEELFDLENDPHETTNLIQDPAFSQVAEDMRRKVKEFRLRTRDPWVIASMQGGETGLIDHVHDFRNLASKP